MITRARVHFVLQASGCPSAREKHYSLVWCILYPGGSASKYNQVQVIEEHKLHQRKIHVDILNAVKNVLADVSSASRSSEKLLRVSTSTLR